MPRNTSHSSDQHEVLVGGLTGQFDGEKLFVRADHISHPNGAPPLVNGFRPDVLAVGEGRRIIGEAETCERLNDGHTWQQLRAFSDATKKPGTELHVAVPQRCVCEFRKKAAKSGVEVTQWWRA